MNDVELAFVKLYLDWANARRRNNIKTGIKIPEKMYFNWLLCHWRRNTEHPGDAELNIRSDPRN